MRRRVVLVLIALAVLLGLAGVGPWRHPPSDPVVASVGVGGLFTDAALDPAAHVLYGAVVPAAYSAGLGKLLLLSTLDGRVRRAVGGNLPVSLLLDAPDHRLFSVDAAEQRVEVLDVPGGRAFATVPFAGLIDALALDRARGRLFILHTLRYEEGSPVYLSTVRIRDGALLETRSIAFDAAGSTGMNNGLLVEEAAGSAFVFDAGGGMLYTIDARTGSVRGARYLQRAGSVALQDVGQGLFVAVSASPPSLSVYSASSGRPVRGFALPAGTIALGGAPVVSGGRVFVDALVGSGRVPARGHAQVVCFGLASGALRWDLSLGGGGALSIDAATDHLFVVDARHGSIRTIDASRGRVVHLSQVAHPGDATIDAARHRLYVASGAQPNSGGAPGDDGMVAVLDTRTGALLRRVAVGVAPQRLLLDAGAHRLLVVGETAPRPRRDPLNWLPAALRRLPGLGFPPAGRGVPTGRLVILDTTRL